jgi:succinate dehydrogenase / fumarate reductase flavoprotein subunit
MRGEVVRDEANTVVPGLYAAGEVACVSVHGSNRLGTNSLLDLVVFGRECGKRAAEFATNAERLPLPADPQARVREQLDRLRSASGTEKVAGLRKELQQVMFEQVGVFRSQDGMSEAVDKIGQMKDRYREVRLDDRGKVFNTDLLEAWELGCLLDIAQVTAVSALNRTESRGAHAREDYRERDDQRWLKHSLAYLEERKISLRYKPVTITKWQPQARTY